ncbi:LamG-like jellyroll fold domain-containing protein [Actinosynnema sp. NPDC020468]|uniref:LamG-like jellyroll fold domain-containing protein n=1 Tax=Actinosynnema sp. NPDC020468 TaxID=3154488 RepID=UPI0033D45B1B
MGQRGLCAAVVVVLLVLGSASSESPPAPPLPPGASVSAPRQQSGTAEGVSPDSPSGETSTALGAQPHDTPRPPGAVPDQVAKAAVGAQPDVTAQPHDKPTVAQPVDLPALDAKAKERPQDRTATTETFDNPDGSRTLRVHPGPANVRQGGGDWQPVDLALTDRDGRWAPRTAPNDTGFARAARDPELVRLAFDDRHGLSYRLDGAADVEATTAGATATYPNALSSVDVKLTATAGGVKEDLVLTSAAAGNETTFTLTPRGLTPRLADGAVELVDGAQVVAVVPRGFAQDARGRRVDTTYRLTRDGDAWRLVVALDPAWLHDPARAFPVVVDPTTSNLNADDSTYVTPGAPGKPGEIDLRTGYVDGGLSRSYLHFGNALNAVRNQYVLAGALVVEAGYSTTCAPRSVSVFEVTEPWSASLSWPGAAVGRSLSTKAFAHGGPSCAGAAWEKLALDQNVLTDWTHGAAMGNGLALRASDETDRNGMRFGSTHSPNQPYLEVRYVPEGVRFEVTDVTLPSASRAGRLKVDATNLGTSAWTAGGGIKFGYIVNQGSTKIRAATGWTANAAPGAKVAFDVPIDPLAPGDYQVFLTMFTPQGQDFFVAYQVPYGRFDITVRNTPPTSNLQQPGGGAIVPTLTPTLYAEGVDDDHWPGKGLTYKFLVCADENLGQGCQESPWTGQSWAPTGLSWNRAYFWGVKVYDTVDATPSWVSAKDGARLVFTPRVHQPEITSHLAGSPGGDLAPGLDPQIGNYSTVVTDASVDTVGPDLTIGRTYNSLDPRRDTAFGVGWSSRVDMRLAKDQDGTDNVVVTFPTGRQSRFGRNPDGSFAPPFGQNADLVYQPNGTYVLRDATASRWTFDVLGRLTAITDPAGLVETLAYDTNDHVTTITNTSSGRALRLTWQGAHVASVSTPAPDTGGPPLTWSYTYDGDKLVKACAPGNQCTQHTYRSGSHYRSSVADDNPHAYWRLGETSGDTVANALARRPGADAGRQHGVVLGGDGALGGTSDKAGTFDGTSSYVTLPDDLTTDTMSLSVELWFRTTAQGTLLSYADQSFPAAAGKSTPILYVGTDGLLYGGFARRDATGPRQVVTSRQVDDGGWHHVVLTAAIDTQTLYLDGVAAGTLAGYVDHAHQGRLTLGGGNGKDWPATNNGDFYFQGAVDEVALYRHPLGALAARQHFAAAKATDELTGLALPQDGRTFATVAYDDVEDRVRTLTDHDGRTWTLDTPAVRDSTRTATLRGPAGYGDWTYTFDVDNGGRLVDRTHDGATARIEYNAAGFPFATVDENGHRTERATDERGNVLSVKTCRAAGSCNTTYATYVKPAGALDPRGDRLESSSDGRSTGPDDTRFRTSYTYDALGRPTSVKYPTPEGLTAAPTETSEYSTGAEDAVGGGKVPAGLLVRSTGRRGQPTTRRYAANGDLAEVTTPSGLTLRYAYDLLGRQKSATEVNAGGTALATTSYEYTPRGLVSKVTGPAVPNAVTGVTHSLVTTYRYDADGNTLERTLADTAPGETARTTKYGYDGGDRVVRVEFPDGGVQTTSYADNGLTEAVTDVRGTTWTTRYTEFGKPLNRVASGAGVNPENPAATTMTLEARSYDPAGRLASVTDAMGRLTKYTYYDDDLPATTRRGNLVVDQRSYDAAGQLVEQVGAGGGRTTHAYDPAGNAVTTTVDPTGVKRTTTARYDADGNALTVELRGAADPNRVEKSSHTYDPAGNHTREDTYVDATTVISSTAAYDERGLPIATVDRRGVTTNFEYDPAHALVRTTAPAAEVWVAGTRTAGFRQAETLGYNAFGEVTQSRDGAGDVTTTQRDVLGRVVAGVLPDYTPPGGTTIKGATSRTEYDHAGNAVKSTDALNHVTGRTFDPYGRVLTVTLPQVGATPSVVEVHYDKAGEILARTAPGGAETRSTYDDLGREVTSTRVDHSSGSTAYFTTTTAYDDAGNPVSVTSPAQHTTTAAYNAVGEQVSTTDATARATTYGYDIAGRPASVTDPAGITTTTGYDLAGRAVRSAQVVGGQEKRFSTTAYDGMGDVVATTSAQGRQVAYGRDELGRVVQQVEKLDATHAITTATGYDKLGNRSRFVDGDGHVTTYTYTPWGQPESVVEPGNAAFTTGYDAAGRAVREVKPGGVTTTTDYDEQDRPTVHRGSGAEVATADRTFGYDAAGRLNKVGGPRGDSTYRYDDRGNLLETHGAGGESTFRYDGDGALVGRTDATGAATFGYDAAGRLATVKDPLTGRSVDYGYDAAGRLSTVADRVVAAKTSRTITYDELGRTTTDRLTQTVDVGVPPRTLVGVDYGYDLDDKVTAKTTNAAANTYGYDGAGRLTSWTRGTTTTAYGWDGAGNRTSVGDKTFTYDDRNRLVSGDGATYTYTDRGTLSSTTRAGSTSTTKFDAFDRMTVNGQGTYRYDSLDRVADRNGQAFQYSGRSNEAISDGARSISRLPDGTALSDKGSGVARMLFADRHGDVTARYLSNTVDGTREFDPFGAVTSASGDTASVGFQGDWTDADTGAVNMTARWYRPGAGAFAGRDDWTLDPTPSSAANRYSYGVGDPVGVSDPSGHDWISDVCDLGGVGGRYNPASKWARRLAKAGSILGTVVNQMICNAPATRAGCGDQLKDSNGHYCPGKEWTNPYYWEGGNEEPIRIGDCRYFVHGCDRGGPTGRGPGGSGGHRPVPPRAKPTPPPPPRWVVDIGRPLPRPPQGSDLLPVPPTYDPTGPLTRILDLTDTFVDLATKVSRALVDNAGQVISAFQDLIGLLPDPSRAKGEIADDPFADDAEDCFASTGKIVGNDPMEKIVGYSGPYEGKGDGLPALRATAGTACVSELTEANRKKMEDPVGYVSGVHDRSHLIGHQFGGSNLRDNLVPLDKDVNETDMRMVEREIALSVTGGARLYYRVEARYRTPGDAIPYEVDLHARTSAGFRCDAVILNPHVPNGYPGGKKDGNRPACAATP